MMKSELYHLAQDAVLDSSYSNEVKLEILRVLFDAESLELYREKEGDEE